MAESSPRVLVVDDQPEILDVAQTMLTSAGYRVTTVSNGRDALERLAGEAFDLLLLDINMPGFDGWEILRSVRCRRAWDDLPVVLFSIKGQVRDKLHALQHGAAGYVTKPFTEEQLLEPLDRLLGRVRPGPSPEDADFPRSGDSGASAGGGSA